MVNKDRNSVNSKIYRMLVGLSYMNLVKSRSLFQASSFRACQALSPPASQKKNYVLWPSIGLNVAPCRLLVIKKVDTYLPLLPTTDFQFLSNEKLLYFSKYHISCNKLYFGTNLIWTCFEVDFGDLPTPICEF